MRENETVEQMNERIRKHKQKVYNEIKNDSSEKAQKLWAKLKQEFPSLDSQL
jgi:hypothetical protein